MDYFMKSAKIDGLFEIVQAIAKMSKDEHTKVGSLIVDTNYRSVSWGYNGFIRSANDEEKLSDEVRREFSVHAETNAILFAQMSLVGCRMFNTYSPCTSCLKHIIQVGIEEVYYLNTYLNTDLNILSKLLQISNLKIYNYSNGLSLMDDIILLSF